jgi:hypothetical protein
VKVLETRADGAICFDSSSDINKRIEGMHEEGDFWESAFCLQKREKGRGTVKTKIKLLALALLPGLAFLTTAAQGQTPAATSGPKRVYTQKTNFKLPIRIDDKDRPNILEVRLYVKYGLTGPWQPISVPPSQSSFNYQATQDGEYWFNVATMDRSGRQTPADVSTEQPKLIVIVDTKPPEVTLRKISAISGDLYVQCDAQDTNLDPSKTTLEYLAKDQTWKSLDHLPDQSNIFRAPDTESCQGMVRATVYDRANNKTVCELNLTGTDAVRSSSSTPGSSETHAASEIQLAGYHSVPSTFPEKGMLPPVQEAAGSRGLDHYTSELMNHQMVSCPHVVLAYQIDQQGPGGVGKVEVWMTRDKGQTWKYLCDDPDRKSPVAIDLPGDGLYGLSLVVANGAGGSCTPPAAGETPDWWVEVDTTKPVAQITSVQTENGALIVTWSATDNCLRAEPIDLYCANRPEGPWLPIARGLRNDGSYRWIIPANFGAEIFVRMDVTDRAGNVTTCQTSKPGMPVAPAQSHPKAHVLGLAPSDQRITSPQAH